MPRNNNTVCWKLLAFVPLLIVLGCLSHPALKSDLVHFSDEYSTASDKALLLTLARLAENAPAYFVQLGSFSSEYQFTSTAGLNPSKVSNVGSATQGPGGSPVSALTLGGSVSAGVTEQPIFQFLPLNGTNYVQAIFSPITDKELFTFYDQRYPADWVARTMIASVEHDVVINASSYSFTNDIPEVVNAYTNRVVLGNDSTAGPFIAAITNYTTNRASKSVVTSFTNYTTNIEVYVNNPDDPTYPQFLEFCKNLRYCQAAHILSVGTVQVTNQLVFYHTCVTITDVVAGINAGLNIAVVDPNTGLIKAVQSQSSTNLIFTWKSAGSEEQRQRFYDQNLVALVSDTNRQIFYDNQATNTDLANAINFAIDYTNKLYKMKMFTVESAMYHAAREEEYFRGLLDHGRRRKFSDRITFDRDEHGPLAAVVHEPSREEYRIRPILTLWYDSHASEPAERAPSKRITEIGDPISGPREYMIADPDGSTQNRTVFTMLNYLFADTAISTQNLPVQQLIQVP